MPLCFRAADILKLKKCNSGTEIATRIACSLEKRLTHLLPCQFSHHRCHGLPRLQRPPMRYDPESIISRGGLEAPSLLAFLHENYPGFVADSGAPERQQAAGASGAGGPQGLAASEAVDDVATIAAYLSDSGERGGDSGWGKQQGRWETLGVHEVTA